MLSWNGREAVQHWEGGTSLSARPSLRSLSLSPLWGYPSSNQASRSSSPESKFVDRLGTVRNMRQANKMQQGFRHEPCQDIVLASQCHPCSPGLQWSAWWALHLNQVLQIEYLRESCRSRQGENSKLFLSVTWSVIQEKIQFVQHIRPWGDKHRAIVTTD
jgi:hypothetical protein